MDSIYAIGAGLGLRFVVDTVTRHDFKITGTLVGLWEGVILLHFMKKMPRSSDPLIAFAVRLFIDFIITESISRFVLVVIWTGMGMVLADITPAVWEDVGMRRTWRHFRRDLYTISERIPTVAFYPPTRTVRFSPSREPSVIEPLEADADAQVELPSDASSSVDMTEHPTLTDIVPPISNSDELSRRRVPGYFPGAFSDTDSVLSSAIGRRRLPSTLQHDRTRTGRRLSVYPTGDFNSDIDEANLSSTHSSESTATPTASLNVDISAVTDIPDEDEPPILSTQMEDFEEALALKDGVDATPKPSFPVLPPTPSDSHAPYKHRYLEEDSVRRRVESIPQIPDLAEDNTTDGGEKVSKEAAERPPTPPEKDWPKRHKKTTTFTNAAPTTFGGEGLGITEYPQTSERSNDNSRSRKDATTINNETTNAHERRLSQPPAYSAGQFHGDADDIYEPEDTETILREEEDRLRKEGEERRRKEEERRLQEAEEQRKEAKKKADKEERERKEAEDAANREKKRAQNEAERLRRLAETKKADEEIALKKKEEAVQKEAEEAAQEKKDEEAVQKEEEEVVQKEEAEVVQKEEEAVQKEEEEVVQKEEKEEEEVVQKEEKEEEEAVQKEEEEAVQKEEEAVQEEEEEAVQKEEEEAAQNNDEEAAQKKKDEDASQKKEDQCVQANLVAQTTTIPPAPEREEHGAQEREKGVASGMDEEVFQEEEHQRAQADASAQTTANSTAGLGNNDGDNQRTPTPSNIPDSDSTFQRQNVLHGDEERAAEQRMETDTVTTEQSEVPQEVGDRLKRVLLLKAQILKIQTLIEQSEEEMKGADEAGKARIEQSLHPMQKTLRKMIRTEQRRWEAGSHCHFLQYCSLR